MDGDNDNIELDNVISSNCFLDIFDMSIVLWNINALKTLYDIKKICVPKDLNCLSSFFSSLDKDIEKIDDCNNNNPIKNNQKRLNNNFILYYSSAFTNSHPKDIVAIINSNEKTISLPCNTIIGKEAIRKELKLYNYTYPWEFLENINVILQNEIEKTIISEKAVIADSAKIKGPCIIEDNVVIDDFSKIKVLLT
jgi:UDP-N-acetylglucosamine diphosphorylase / glucose-1-phosphate thymidylyltransferase / UDP-N-acetylgalactosamine diphosphorylase / glucosamine-1-phosphate N-acetyltransferase / galactosamine-1-phosphate N-acetyltransferase